MNIFALHEEAALAALFHCDIHTNSQLREAGQMLSTAVRLKLGEPGEVLFHRKGEWKLETRMILPQLGEMGGMKSYDGQVYWEAYVNHPCTKWVMENWANYNWLYRLMIELGRGFEFRYGKEHGTIQKLHQPLNPYFSDLVWKVTEGIPFGLTEMTPHALAMPERYRDENVVQAYRAYYIGEKEHLWSAGYGRGVPPPEWLRPYID